MRLEILRGVARFGARHGLRGQKRPHVVFILQCDAKHRIYRRAVDRQRHAACVGQLGLDAGLVGYESTETPQPGHHQFDVYMEPMGAVVMDPHA
jgi:hypothetical protein